MNGKHPPLVVRSVRAREERRRGPGLPHPTREDREGDSRLGTAVPRPSRESPSASFPTSGCSIFRGVVPAANLLSSRPAALQSPVRWPEPRQDPHRCPLRAREAALTEAPSAGDFVPFLPAPAERAAALSGISLLPTREHLGGGPHSLPANGALAWVLPARNRFIRDLLPLSQFPSKAGRR